jgi:ferredoxin
VNKHHSQIYFSFAEVFASGDLPDWIVLPGKNWPLYKSASCLSSDSPAARKAIPLLAEIPPETKTEREARYTQLFNNPGWPQLMLYESTHLSGRLLGPECMAVEKWYRNAGLEVADTELPDHASLELAFLGHLTGLTPPAHTMERSFVRQHAGRWLPALGRSLALIKDSVYGPVGSLLAAWLDEVLQPRKMIVRSPYHHNYLPLIQSEERCSLCGFCVQICPAGALSMRQTHDEVYLILSVHACIGCKKCERICEFDAIHLDETEKNWIEASDLWKNGEQIILRHSKQSLCYTCGYTIASQAEMDYVRCQLGNPEWLDYCPECRSTRLEA